MKMTTRHLGWWLASLALASTASAVEVDINLGDRFQGLIRDASEEDRLTFHDIMGTQVDAQLAGSIPGTDGQNVIAVGAMPTWNFTEHWSLYLSLNGVGAWDRRFAKHNGWGAGFDAQFIYSNDGWWPGASR